MLLFRISLNKRKANREQLVNRYKRLRMCMYRQGMVYKCAQKERNDRFANVQRYMYVFVCMCILYNRFMCYICVQYVLCVCLYMYACICMCMSSLPRALLLPNLSPKYPYFLPILFVHAVFGVVGSLFFVFFCLYTYTIFFVGSGV